MDFEERMQQIREKNLWDPNEILPRLFLGNGKDASNLEKLKQHGFTHIVNVANDVENFYPQEFEYLNLNVGDFGSDEGISRVFPEAFSYLKEHWKEGEGTVLVHCAAGMNRSAALCIAAVMYFEDLSLLDAWNIVIKARRVSPLQDNREELVKFEVAHTNKSTMDANGFRKGTNAAK